MALEVLKVSTGCVMFQIWVCVSYILMFIPSYGELILALLYEDALVFCACGTWCCTCLPLALTCVTLYINMAVCECFTDWDTPYYFDFIFFFNKIIP